MVERRAKRWAGKGWTAEMVAALAAEPDDATLAERFGKTANAVRVMRQRVGRGG